MTFIAQAKKSKPTKTMNKQKAVRKLTPLQSLKVKEIVHIFVYKICSSLMCGHTEDGRQEYGEKIRRMLQDKEEGSGRLRSFSTLTMVIG